MMKTLYETIFDQEASLDNVINTRPLMNVLSHNGVDDFIVDVKKHTLNITKVQKYVDIQLTLINLMKKYGLDTLIISDPSLDSIDMGIRVYNVNEAYSNINIEAPNKFIRLYAATDSKPIIGLSIAADNIKIMVGNHPCNFKKCTFTCNILNIDEGGSFTHMIDFDTACKFNTKVLNYMIADRMIIPLYEKNCNIDRDHLKLVGLFDFLPVPVQVAKTIDEIHIAGWTDRAYKKYVIAKTQRLAYSKTSPNFMRPVELDVRGPWKFGGVTE